LKNLKWMEMINKMLKIIFIVIVVFGIIAYTGIDVSSEYDLIADGRDVVLDNMFDPLVKKVLEYATNSNLDEIAESSLERYEK